MSISTQIRFLDGNDKFFLRAKESEESKAKWEEEWGPMEDRPGSEIEDLHDAIRETDDEYGG